jgi:hypothetical protein
VVSSPAELPWLTLAGPPRTPDSDALGDVLRALAGDETKLARLRPEMLEDLFEKPGSPAVRPTIRRGRPASFLLLSPAIAGEIDLGNAGLSAVYINGVEVRGGSR